MLGLDDVGHRVVVRRIMGVRGDRPVFSDVIGNLIDIDGSHLVVDSASGPVRVPCSEVATAKRIPAPRIGTAQLERLASAAWPAVETETLGGWQLRASGGWTGRANSALPLGDPGRPVPIAIDTVVRWYADRGLPARINVPLPLCAGIDAELDRRGWTRSEPVLVQTAPLAALAGRASGRGAAATDAPTPPDAGAPTGAPTTTGDVELATGPSPAWLSAIGGFKGPPPAEALAILSGPATVRFATVYAGGAPAAVARGAVVHGYLHLGLVVVDPAHRRRGLAARVTRALAGWALRHRAHTAFLQVERSNTAAAGCYAGLGFTTHHTYVTRTAAR